MSCYGRYILGLIEPEIAPFDPPTLKTLLCRNKHEHEMDRMTRCWDMVIRHSKFDISRGMHLGPPVWEKGRSWGSTIVPFERAMLISYMA